MLTPHTVRVKLITMMRHTNKGAREMDYNGHKNWNHWNVSLWLFNDESLYSLMRQSFRKASTKDGAAEWLTRQLDGESTPDGAKYSYTAIRAALKGFTVETPAQKRAKVERLADLLEEALTPSPFLVGKE
jgi:hypothetical protein